MAAPHVSGVAAMYLARNNSLTPDDLLVELKRDALANKIIGLIGSTNLLLSSAAIRKSPPIVPAPVQSPASSPSQSNIPVPDNSTSLPPSQTPDKPQACGIVIFSRCEVDSDCCLKACRQFGELLDKRCFFF